MRSLLDKLGGTLFVKKVAAAFGLTFLASFTLGISNVWQTVDPDGDLADLDWSAGGTALRSLLLASVVGGLRAAQALFTTWETPDEVKAARAASPPPSDS